MRKGNHVNVIAQISYRVGNNFLSHLFWKFNGRMILNLLQSKGPKNADLRLSRRHVWNLFLHSMTKTSSLSDFFLLFALNKFPRSVEIVVGILIQRKVTYSERTCLEPAMIASIYVFRSDTVFVAWEQCILKFFLLWNCCENRSQLS